MEDRVEQVLERRRREQRRRLPAVGLAGTAILHAVLVLAAVLVPRLGEAERQPIEYVAVQIVPAQALGSPRPPRSEPPRPEPPAAPEPDPEPEPEIEEPEPEAEDVLPAPQTRPEPERPEPREEPRREPPREQPREETPPAAPQTPPGAGAGDRQGSPQGDAAGTSALGARVATLGDPDFTYGYYLDRVLAAIEANWRRPPTDVPIEVTLDFRIRRDGSVAELDVHQSSGLNAFDLAGLRAVQGASPLPPLPAGYRKDSLAIRLVIR